MEMGYVMWRRCRHSDGVCARSEPEMHQSRGLFFVICQFDCGVRSEYARVRVI